MKPSTSVAAAQFGATASAYLTSAVHATGADLAQLPGLMPPGGAARVLDLGCGAGHAAFAVAPAVGAVIACDPTPEMLAVVAAEAARRGIANLSTRQAQAEQLPFADASIDAVVTRMSAHHWRDLPAALAEVARVLTPDAPFIVIDVLGHADPMIDAHLQAAELLRDRSHVRNRNAAEWRGLLDSAGFDLTAQQAWRLAIGFDDWVARMHTSAARVAAIRELWRDAPEEARAAYKVQTDYSFELDCGMFTARRRG